ncbi:MAG: hypothetical protein FVQ79_00105 [Planctomycetes bacterium]|nr:hypothetical protein [Planctomycetota bacterium]
MKTYYFSFGQDHTHRIDGVTLDADVLLKVTAEGYNEARQKVFDAIGPKWSFQYDDDTMDLKYFPRGIVEVPSI